MRSLRKTEGGTEKRYKCARRQKKKNAARARSRQKPIINSVTSRCSTRQLLLFVSAAPLFVRSLLCPLAPSRSFIFALINLPRDRFNRRAPNFFSAKKKKRLPCIEIEERLQFSIKLQDAFDKYDCLEKAGNKNANDVQNGYFLQ